ncbi:hypothetical protein EK21DRAFT_60291, partial [Setomelanomma holmii]
SFTYDHRFEKLALPVRSAVLKLVTGGLVVRWVTTGEYPLLYVFWLFACSENLDIQVLAVVVLCLLDTETWIFGCTDHSFRLHRCVLFSIAVPKPPRLLRIMSCS